MENPINHSNVLKFCSCFLFFLTVGFWRICRSSDESPIDESPSLYVVESPPVVEHFEEEDIPDDDYFFYDTDTTVNRWFIQRFFPIQDETPRNSDKTPIENGLP